MALILLFTVPMSAFACTPGIVTINKIVNGGVEPNTTEFTFEVYVWGEINQDANITEDVISEKKPKPPTHEWKPFTTITASEKTPGTFSYAPGDMKFKIVEVSHDGYTQVEPSSVETGKINGDMFYTFTNDFIEPQVGTIEVIKNVIDSNGVDIVDNTSFGFTYVKTEKNLPLTSDTVSEGGIKTLNLPYGTYTFTEVDIADDAYTNITSPISMIVTIDEDNPTKEVLFVNEYKVPDVPVIPVVPVTHHHHTTTIVTPPAVVVTPPAVIVTPVAIIVTPPAITPPAVITEEPVLDVIPQTGGSLDLILLMGLMLISAGGIMLLGRKKETE